MTDPQLQECRLEAMTSREVAEKVEAGYRTAVLACGSIEQHGPHLPMSMDADHADLLAVGVARRIGGTLVAPTIRVGCSQHHMAFPGSMTLSEPTFAAVYRDMCTSLAHHGFTRILCFSAHGGNFGPLARMLGGLQAAVGPNCRVDAFVDLDAFLSVWRAVAAEAGLPSSSIGGHADTAETSILMAVGRRVRDEHVRPGYIGPRDEGFIRRILTEGFHTVTPTGVLGDPTHASAEFGERCIGAMVEMLAAHFGANAEVVEQRAPAT